MWVNYAYSYEQGLCYVIYVYTKKIHFNKYNDITLISLS